MDLTFFEGGGATSLMVGGIPNWRALVSIKYQYRSEIRKIIFWSIL